MTDGTRTVELHGQHYQAQELTHDSGSGPTRTVWIETGSDLHIHMAEVIERAYPIHAALQRRRQRVPAPLSLVTMRVMVEVTAHLRVRCHATLDGNGVRAHGPTVNVVGLDDLVPEIDRATSAENIESLVAAAITWPPTSPAVIIPD